MEDKQRRDKKLRTNYKNNWLKKQNVTLCTKLYLIHGV